MLWDKLRRRLAPMTVLPTQASDGSRNPLVAVKAQAYPDGHFYSPVVNIADIEARAQRIWPATPEVIGIDFNRSGHEAILGDVFTRYLKDFDYPETLPVGAANENAVDHFFRGNSQFSWLDSIALFVLMRHWQPAKIIEVGSGFSSLLMADINRRFLSGQVDITCIEPYPRPFLRRGIAGISRVIEERVEDVDLAVFTTLSAGDMLFIDSSHVSKTGSDVNYLFFEVIPRLNAGVIIHVHDIFLPHDYPRYWVVDEKRSWNEQYLLRALLTHNPSFKIEFGCAYAFYCLPDAVRNALNHSDGRYYGGASLWMRKLAVPPDVR